MEVNLFVLNLLTSFNISNILIYLISRNSKRIYTFKDTFLKCLIISIISSSVYAYFFFFYNFILIYLTLIYGTIILIISAIVFFKGRNINVFR